MMHCTAVLRGARLVQHLVRDGRTEGVVWDCLIGVGPAVLRQALRENNAGRLIERLRQ